MLTPRTHAADYVRQAIEAEQGSTKEDLVNLACEWLAKACPRGVALVLDDSPKHDSDDRPPGGPYPGSR